MVECRPTRKARPTAVATMIWKLLFRGGERAPPGRAGSMGVPLSYGRLVLETFSKAGEKDFDQGLELDLAWEVFFFYVFI